MTDILTVDTVSFGDGLNAKKVTASPEIDPSAILSLLQLPVPGAVLVLNGGAANLDIEVSKKLVRLFECLAEFVIRNKITVVTGGTNSGVFAIFGQALRKKGGASAPCIGVSITGQNVANRMEPNHTHFILVRADNWGLETAMMYQVTAALSRFAGGKSLAIFAGGGAHSLHEMECNVRQKREMIFIAGSKGYTDDVLQLATKSEKSKMNLNYIRNSGLVTAFDIKKPDIDFINLVARKLKV